MNENIVNDTIMLLNDSNNNSDDDSNNSSDDDSNNNSDNDSNNSSDDNSSYETISDDEIIDHTDNLELEGNTLNKFNILYELGKGSYSIVWLAYNIENQKFYAIKVQHPDEYECGKIENNFMKKLPTKYNFNNLIESFTYNKNNKNFLCSVYNLHSCNIDCLLRKGQYLNGLPYDKSILIIKELIESLYYLHNKLNVYHGDLKTDNILVKGVTKFNRYCLDLYKQENFINKYIKEKVNYCNLNNKKIINLSSSDKLKIRNNIHKSIYNIIINKIKECDISKYELDDLNKISISLSDFGSYVDEGEYYNESFGTRYYRSPENILVGKSSYPNDVWALGCTIYEILTGEILFDPDKDKEYDRDFYHLKLINELCGKFPISFLKTTKNYKIYFNKDFDLKFKKDLNFTNKLNGLNLYNIPNHLIELIKKMLIINPKERITIKDLSKLINEF